MTDGWIAREECGSLWFFSNKPSRCKRTWWANDDNDYVLPEDHPIGEGLTWEDEPIQVQFKRVEKEEVQ